MTKKPLKEFFILFYKGIIHLFLLLLLIPPLPGHGQKYLVKHYIENDGIANSKVYDIVQDSSGVVWFATRGGISSYDGLHWTTYSLEDGLLTTAYEKFFLDKKGKLWALPGQWDIHLALFEDNKWHCITSDSDITQTYPYTSFLVDYENERPTAYIGGYSGLFVYKNAKWKHYSTTQGLPSNIINGMSLCNGRIYIATKNGICTFSNGEIHIEKEINDLLPSKSLLGITTEGSDPCKLWVAGQNWVCAIEDGIVKKIKKGLKLFTDIHSFYIRLVPDMQGGIYLGNPGTIYHIPESFKTIEHLGIKNGLITEGATGILIDREKNLWITSLRGVNKIQTRRFANYNKDHGLFDNEVTSIVEKAPGEYFLGHYNGITKFTRDQATSISFPEKKGVDNMEARILDMVVDNENNIWIAASQYGLVKITPDNQIILFDDLAKNENVSSVAISPEGQLLVATDHKLFTFSGEGFHPVTLPSDTNISFRKICFSKDTILYICTYAGLIAKKGDSWKLIKAANKSYSNNIYSVFEAPNEIIYVGMLSGLFNIDNGRLVKTKLGKHQIDRPVYLIFSDTKNRLWIGSDNGVYRWDGKQLKHYTSNDGLSGQELNRDAGLVDHEGIIWLGTNNGLSEYRESYDYDTTDLPAPLVSIDFVITEKDTIYLQEPLELNYNHKSLTFHFTGISFIDEVQLYFKCKLEGRDKTWSPEFRALDNTYRFQNLQPGEYTFKLKAKNALGEWSNVIESPGIKIQKPIWEQTWFIVLGILTFLAIVYEIWRGFNNRLYAKKLKQEVKERTRELRESESKLKQLNSTKDKLFSIIGHDLKSPFNTILGYSDLLLQEYKYLSDEEKLKFIRQIRNSSGKTYELLQNLLLWAIAQDGNLKFNPTNIDVAEIAEDNLMILKTIADKKNISVINGIEKGSFAYADKEMTDTIFRNIISNALKFTDANGKIILTSKKSEQYIKIRITDTGQGISEKILENIFEPEKRNSNQERVKESGTGLGLVLCKEFVERNGGTIEIQSQEEKGTTVIFTLPLFPS